MRGPPQREVVSPLLIRYNVILFRFALGTLDAPGAVRYPWEHSSGMKHQHEESSRHNQMERFDQKPDDFADGLSGTVSTADRVEWLQED